VTPCRRTREPRAQQSRAQQSPATAPQLAGWSPRNLAKPGLVPRTVIDVGANVGTPALYEAFPESFLVLVEPLAECEPALRAVLAESRGLYLPVAVGSHLGSVIINVEPRRNAKSSILSRTDLTVTGDQLERREVPLMTLDAIAAEHRLEPPFGLKIDTEGYEIDVVEGATELLREAQFVIAEVSIADRFVESYSFADFIAIMDSRGFRVCDILRGGARYADIMFAAKTVGRTERRGSGRNREL
jgi:FkbM family methyltransferase